MRVPTAMAVFPNEFVPEGEPPRSWYERLYDVRAWTVLPRAGISPQPRSPTCWPATSRTSSPVRGLGASAYGSQ